MFLNLYDTKDLYDTEISGNLKMQEKSFMKSTLCQPHGFV